MKKKKILFVYQNFSSFVSTDYDILSLNYSVKKYQFKPVKGLLKTFTSLLKQFGYLLLHIWKYDAVYIWFADYFSFMPVIFASILKKKSFVVIGGYDVARDKRLKYGALYSKLRGFFTINSIKLCSVNLTVSSFIDRKVHFIAPKSNRVLLYNCVNIIDLQNLTSRENLILTVGIIDSERTFYIKGIDIFIQLARLISDYKFKIVGVNKQKISHLFTDIPVNLSIVPIVNHTELQDFYKKAKFYCQFSRIESFGVAIVESISFGCIPIVTNIGAMPEIVGNATYIVPQEIEKIASVINSYTKTNDTEEAIRKERVYTMFSFENRKHKLISLLRKYM